MLPLLSLIEVSDSVFPIKFDDLPNPLKTPSTARSEATVFPLILCERINTSMTFSELFSSVTLFKTPTVRTSEGILTIAGSLTDILNEVLHAPRKKRIDISRNIVFIALIF